LKHRHLQGFCVSHVGVRTSQLVLKMIPHRKVLLCHEHAYRDDGHGGNLHNNDVVI